MSWQWLAEREDTFWGCVFWGGFLVFLLVVPAFIKHYGG